MSERVDCTAMSGEPWIVHGRLIYASASEFALAASTELATEIVTLRSRLAAVERERDRLRRLVGDEAAGGAPWHGIPRSEAIRQADEFHAGQMRWMREHDARRDERDEARSQLADTQAQLAEAVRSLAEYAQRLDAGVADRERAVAAEARLEAVKALLDCGEGAWCSGAAPEPTTAPGQ